MVGERIGTGVDDGSSCNGSGSGIEVVRNDLSECDKSCQVKQEKEPVM